MKEDMFFSEEEFASARKYWLNQLSGDINELDFPHDYLVKIVTTDKSKKENYTVDVPGSVSEQIFNICKERDLLLYIISAAVLKVLLFKYTGQEEIVIAAPVYTTSDEYYEYNNCIPLIDILNDRMTFRELLSKVKDSVIEGYKNQHYSIDNILRTGGVSRDDLNYIKVIFMLANIHKRELADAVVNSSANEITITLEKTGNHLGIDVFYNPFLFKRDTIHCLLEYYLQVYRQVLLHRDITLGEIEGVTPEEKRKILFEFNNTPGHPLGQLSLTVCQLFEQQVKKNYNRVALVFHHQQITYSELNRRSLQVGHLLREKGVMPGTIVGMAAEYSLEMIIGIIGILKAGGAYLPIDPGYPGARIHYMLTDAGVGILLIQQHLISRVDFQGIVVKLENPGTFQMDGEIPVKTNPINNLAYVIYTSGSTGKSKGVMVEHPGLVNYAAWKIETFGFTFRDRTLQLISVSFDGFGANLYPSLLSGGVLVLPDGNRYGDFRYINRLILKWSITHMSVVPVMYRASLENARDDELKSLRIVVLAGERASDTLIDLSHKKNKNVMLINEYGPTEGTIAVSAYPGITVDKVGLIGKPAANIRIYILNPNDRLQPIGVPGELVIAGVGLARGYLNRPELTAEKFNRAVISSSTLSPNDQCPMTNDRLYRTGDRGRWLMDGNLELLGRMDQQVKIRGYRVEPSEIATVILGTGWVKEVVVISRQDEMVNNYLCAYFTPARVGEKIKISQLRECLSKTLPDYMIPTRFIQLEKLPVTPTGKLDGKALPVPDRSVNTGVEFVEPTSEIEKKLAEIWQEVLAVEAVGINDNFFDLGGNSILLMQVNEKIEKIYPDCLTITDFFAYPTIARLIGFIEKKWQKPGGPIQIESVKLPRDYFCDVPHTHSSANLHFRVPHDVFEKMKSVCQKDSLECSQILLSVYMALLAKITRQQAITLQTMCWRKNRVIPLAVNLSQIEDFSRYFKLIIQVQQEKEHTGYDVEDTGKIEIKKEENAVVPFFYRKEMFTAKCNLLDTYDIVLEVREEEEEDLNVFCEFGNRLKEEKVEELLKEYMKLNHFVMTQCLDKNDQ